MLTLITGTPGAGKSLYAVSQLAVKVPGSTVEDGQTAVPRKLYSNVKDLLVEHTQIDGDDLNKWHEWAKPGDVILFDEVQEVWRPRGLGSKVPECIAALETHRHKGVDLILVTQHPMLVDPNIRRLVNQHIHLRRLSKATAYVYEWDHCANPGQTRTCINSRFWFHPKSAYKLYKSAQLHTKPTARIPRLAWVGVLALAAGVYLVPTAYGRLNKSLGAGGIAGPVPAASAPQTIGTQNAQTPIPPDTDSEPEPVPALVRAKEKPAVAGCVWTPQACKCFDTGGGPVEPVEAMCNDHRPKVVEVPEYAIEPARANPEDNDVLRYMRLHRPSLVTMNSRIPGSE